MWVGMSPNPGSCAEMSHVRPLSIWLISLYLIHLAAFFCIHLVFPTMRWHVSATLEQSCIFRASVSARLTEQPEE